MKRIILLIAHKGYQPIEYAVTKEVLLSRHIEVITASDQSGMAVANDSSATLVDLIIDAIDPEQYDGLFLVGGPGALEWLNIPEVHKLLQEMKALKKPIGAICISSRILAHSHVLAGKKATGWNGDNQLKDIFERHAVTYVNEPVVIDGIIITATGPEAAKKFGEAIAKVI